MDSSLLLSQITSAAIVVYAVQWLKNLQIFPWVTQETKALNRGLAAIGAIVSAIGIHFAFGAQPGPNGEVVVITISGLTAANVVHGLWHVATQCAFQQLTYDVVGSRTGEYVDPALSATRVRNVRPHDQNVSLEPAPALSLP